MSPWCWVALVIYAVIVQFIAWALCRIRAISEEGGE
jgi:hypothetical protein